MVKYSLNECILYCDLCGREQKMTGRELVKARRTPRDMAQMLGWREIEEKDYCSHCAAIFEQEEQNQKNKPNKYCDFLKTAVQYENDTQTKTAYIMEISHKLEKLSQSEEILENEILLKTKLYELIGMLSSI